PRTYKPESPHPPPERGLTQQKGPAPNQDRSPRKRPPPNNPSRHSHSGEPPPGDPGGGSDDQQRSVVLVLRVAVAALVLLARAARARGVALDVAVGGALGRGGAHAGVLHLALLARSGVLQLGGPLGAAQA